MTAPPRAPRAHRFLARAQVPFAASDRDTCDDRPEELGLSRGTRRVLAAQNPLAPPPRHLLPPIPVPVFVFRPRGALGEPGEETGSQIHGQDGSLPAPAVLLVPVLRAQRQLGPSPSRTPGIAGRGEFCGRSAISLERRSLAGAARRRSPPRRVAREPMALLLFQEAANLEIASPTMARKVAATLSRSAGADLGWPPEEKDGAGSPLKSARPGARGCPHQPKC